MTRAAFLLSLGAVAVPAQMMEMGEASEGFVSLFNGQDLGQWVGGEPHWKVERGVLAGTSDGKSESALILGGREYGDVDLRFDLRVKQGAGHVKLRGREQGPLGVELAVGTSVFQWARDGSSSTVIGSVKQGEWNTYRIVNKGDRFEAFQNGKAAGMTLVAGHEAPRGKLWLLMPAGARSEVEFRNIRVKA